MQSMTGSKARSKVFTYGILFFLLFVSFLQSFLVLIYDDLLDPSIRDNYADVFRFWVIVLYQILLLGGAPLIALVVILNQDRLRRLNMDRLYIVFLIIAGLIGVYLSLINDLWLIAAITIVAVIYFVYALLIHKIEFAFFERRSLPSVLLVIAMFAAILYIISILTAIKVNFPLSEQASLEFLLEDIPFAIYEEAIFRGLLYMFFTDLGLSRSKVFFGQAFLFWLNHINRAIPNPMFFWVVLPILSLVLGYVVLRSKSLTLGTITHIIYNALSALT